MENNLENVKRYKIISLSLLLIGMAMAVYGIMFPMNRWNPLAGVVINAGGILSVLSLKKQGHYSPKMTRGLIATFFVPIGLCIVALTIRLIR